LPRWLPLRNAALRHTQINNWLSVKYFLSEGLWRKAQPPSAQATSPHDLRQTGAKIIVSERLGFAPQVVSRVLSHRTDYGGAALVTIRHYAIHNYAPEKRRAFDAWEGLLLEIVGQRVAA
jgi:hypothetical protein